MSGRIFEPGRENTGTRRNTAVLQRTCACGQHTRAGGECEGCKNKRLDLQRSTLGQGRGDRGEGQLFPPIVQETLRSPGQPLDPGMRQYMESRFGHDFSQVRVHTDSRAADSARVVNAFAYTVGDEIAFGTGQYSPHTSAGKRLLAHELAHVVQQQGLGTGRATSTQQFYIQENSSPLESQADQAAERVAAGGQAPEISPVPNGRLQRQDAGTTPDSGQVCGTYEDFLKSWFIDPNIILDGATCLCFGAGLADLVPFFGIGSNPIVEQVDCACNIFTTLQEIYNRGSDGGCWSIGNLANPTDVSALTMLANLAAIDCTSAPLGTILGAVIVGLIGMIGGTEAGPPGEAGGGIIGAATGAAIGDFVVDVTAMALQNLITQGTVLPESQWAACNRVSRFLKLDPGRSLTPEGGLLAGGFESEL